MQKLKFPHILIVFGPLFSLFVGFVTTSMVANNPYHHRTTLGSKGKYYVLEWFTDWSSQSVTFSVTAETRGYVGFGLSRNGKMAGADIVIGGVSPSGHVYFGDYHAVGNQLPVVDPSQDWEVGSAWENGTHTYLSFSRPFDTCDPQDFPITSDKISVLWALGEDDELEYHYGNKGKWDVYLIEPNWTPELDRDGNGKVVRPPQEHDDLLEDFQTWTVTSKMVIPSEDTTYWCKVIPGIKLNGNKHHVIGVEARFPNELSRTLAHHVGIHRCYAPPGTTVKELFQPHVHSEGQACPRIGFPQGPIPTQYCSEFFFVYAIGSRPFFLPPHVGSPIGESPDEYYVLQVHYDNPLRLANAEVELSFDIFYTSQLRPNDGGVMAVRSAIPGLPPTILVPPYSIDHSVYAHCGPQCTREMLPPEGIRVVGGLLHSHNSGVAINLQHFRGSKVELPWIIGDDNYDNTFQQFRMLHEEVKVLPGDHLVLRCTYDTTWTNLTVVGGYRTRNEMCLVFLIYYNKLKEHAQCVSEMETPTHLHRFVGVSGGTGNLTWSNSLLEYVPTNPPSSHLAGKPISEIADLQSRWTGRERDALRQFHRLHPQVNNCPRVRPTTSGATALNAGFLDDTVNRELVSFPTSVKPYSPKQTCHHHHGKIILGK